MKNLKKILLGTIVSTLFCVYAADWFDPFKDVDSVFNSTISNIENNVEDFSKDFSFSMPMSSSQQNIWADAYIGKIFPSVPVHFGFGVNASATKIDTSGLAKVAKIFDIDDIKNSYYLPYASFDLRVGGVFLPFDLGIMFTKFGPFDANTNGMSLNIDLLTVGFDLRYAILEGNLILPKWSVGLGYIYNKGSLGFGNNDVDVDFDYKMQTMFVETQVSKTIFIFTPFVGIKALVTKSNTNYDWKLKGSVYNTVAAYNTSSLIRTSGSHSYKSDEFDFSNIQPVLFAGCGINFFVLQATLSVSADLKHFNDKKLWGGAFSLRFKL